MRVCADCGKNEALYLYRIEGNIYSLCLHCRNRLTEFYRRIKRNADQTGIGRRL